MAPCLTLNTQISPYHTPFSLLLTVTILSLTRCSNQIHLSNSVPSAVGHTCLIWYGQATCFGDNGYGRLGLGNTNDYDSPPEAAIELLIGFNPITITAGDGHSCALSGDGRVVCWGKSLCTYFNMNTTLRRVLKLSLYPQVGIHRDN